MIDMEKELPKELRAGWAAWWNDKPSEECPFEDHSENRKLWMVGWNGAKEINDQVSKPYLDNIKKYAHIPFVQSWLKLRKCYGYVT